MKRTILSLIVVLLFCANIAYAAGTTEIPKISTQSCILVDSYTGMVIYEKNSDERLYPASITKIMTAILAIEEGNFNKPFIVSQNAIDKVGSGASTVGLLPQEEVFLDDLLYMLMLRSGNDAANVIAENIAGSIKEFVKLMNDKAKEIGAVNTNFSNPIGLDKGDGYPEHKTTARDFALITRYAMSLEKFRQVVFTNEYELPVTNKHNSCNTIVNTNRFLTNIEYNKKLYQVNGGKTGYTSAASNTLVVTARNDDNIELVCVLLKNPDRTLIFNDAEQLLNYGFNLIEDNIIEASEGFYDIRFRRSKDIIMSFERSGYIKGYGDNSFKPLLRTSKEEFITLFMRLENEPCEASGEYWSKPYLDIAVNRNIIDSKWHNERTDTISKFEAIETLSKSLEQYFIMEHPFLQNELNKIRSLFVKEILKLYNGGILSEYNLSSDGITREEMVVLVNEYLLFLKELISAK